MGIIGLTSNYNNYNNIENENTSALNNEEVEFEKNKSNNSANDESKKDAKKFNDVMQVMGRNFLNTDLDLYGLGNSEKFSLPRGMNSIDKLYNTLNLAIGGRLYIPDGYLYIADDHVSAFKNDSSFGGGIKGETLFNDYTNRGYAKAIEGLIRAVESKNSRFSEETSAVILSFLKYTVGLDIGKDIKVNGVTFETVDNMFQTKGYIAQ